MHTRSAAIPTICAFLNSGGGRLVIGVANDRTIHGIPLTPDVDKFLL